MWPYSVAYVIVQIIYSGSTYGTISMVAIPGLWIITSQIETVSNELEEFVKFQPLFMIFFVELVIITNVLTIVYFARICDWLIASFN